MRFGDARRRRAAAPGPRRRAPRRRDAEQQRRDDRRSTIVTTNDPPVRRDIERDLARPDRRRVPRSGSASAALPSHAIRRPAAAPAAASIALSTSSWRTIRPRPAPIARRSAISRVRVAPRASSRFATLTQAIRRTSVTSASATVSGMAQVAPQRLVPVAPASTVRVIDSARLRRLGETCLDAWWRPASAATPHRAAPATVRATAMPAGLASTRIQRESMRRAAVVLRLQDGSSRGSPA